MPEITHTAIGTWSGGRFMHFGEPLPDDRLLALLRPGDDVRTVITADVYGQGAADAMLGRALAGLDRSAYAVAGTVGHDFYDGQRNGAKGFPRFTDPALRGPEAYADYLRMATERSLERVGVDRFDLLMLHNPDRIGYTHPAVWAAMAGLRDAGLADAIGVAPGPANGFTLDLIDCFERYGDVIDWAMIILNPLEPWPGELCLGAAEQQGIEVITRVVDYGGIFHGAMGPGHVFAERDHRAFRPAGWVQAGVQKLARMRPIAERHGLTPLQLAAQWNLAHPTVACVVPTLIQEAGPDARPVEEQRADLAATPTDVLLTDDEVAEIRAIGDNANCMALKGAAPGFDGGYLPDQWGIDDALAQVATRWSIAPERDLVEHAAA